MSSTNILPPIRTLPIPDDESKSLFSRAVQLVLRKSDIFKPVGEWLDRYYSEQSLHDDFLPEMEECWSNTELHLKVKASPEYVQERAASLRKLLNAKGEAAALSACHKMVKREISAERERLQRERTDWQPTQEQRLHLAVTQILKVEYPAVASERIEYSRKLIGIAALLVWPEPMPVLGELGSWEWSSKVYDPGRSGNTFDDALLDALLDEARREAAGPHGFRPTSMHPRTVGREEVMFKRDPREGLKIAMPWDWEWADFVKRLGVAVDVLEMAPPIAPAAAIPYVLGMGLSVTRQGVEGKVEVSKFLHRLLRSLAGLNFECPASELMNQTADALWRETYTGSKKQKDKIGARVRKASEKLGVLYIDVEFVGDDVIVKPRPIPPAKGKGTAA